MNIFLAFLQSKVNHNIPAYSFWQYYIKNGIKEAGFSWCEASVDWAEGLVHKQNTDQFSKWKSDVWEITLKEIKKQHKNKPISFFLSYLYPHQVNAQSIKEIQSLGIPCVNFFCDNVREFKNAPKEFAVFDLNWIPEYDAINIYKKAKYNFIHLPMPMWVDHSYRNLKLKEINEISFIGSKDIQRVMFFEELAQRNLDIKIYGAGWISEESTQSIETIKKNSYLQTANNQINFVKRYGLPAYYEKLKQNNPPILISAQLQAQLNGKIEFEDYIKRTRQSIITLGINRYPSFNYPLKKPNTYSRLRDIEAPMLGACYITEYTQGLEFLYELGTEIETYKNAEELSFKIENLKKDKNKRDKLRVEGQKRSLNQHCIPNSLSKISTYFNG